MLMAVIDGLADYPKNTQHVGSHGSAKAVNAFLPIFLLRYSLYFIEHRFLGVQRIDQLSH
jgi:hypothetical protein